MIIHIVQIKQMRDKLVKNLGSGGSRLELSLSPEMGLVHHDSRAVPFYRVLQPSQNGLPIHAWKSLLEINIWPSEKDGAWTQRTYSLLSNWNFCCWYHGLSLTKIVTYWLLCNKLPHNVATWTHTDKLFIGHGLAGCSAPRLFMSL